MERIMLILFINTFQITLYMNIIYGDIFQINTWTFGPKFSVS